MIQNLLDYIFFICDAIKQEVVRLYMEKVDNSDKNVTYRKKIFLQLITCLTPNYNHT